MEKEPLKITIVKDGPAVVHAEAVYVLPDGSVVRRGNAPLCRCGKSQTQPFCDGSHLKK